MRVCLWERRGCRVCRWVGKIVPAARADGANFPVPLDEFVDGDVVSIVVVNNAAGRILGNHQQWDARAVAEKVQRLHVAGVIVAAAFAEGDEDRRIVPIRRILHQVDDLLRVQLKHVELRR